MLNLTPERDPAAAMRVQRTSRAPPRASCPRTWLTGTAAPRVTIRSRLWTCAAVAGRPCCPVTACLRRRQVRVLPPHPLPRQPPRPAGTAAAAVRRSCIRCLHTSRAVAACQGATHLLAGPRIRSMLAGEQGHMRIWERFRCSLPLLWLCVIAACCFVADEPALQELRTANAQIKCGCEPQQAA